MAEQLTELIGQEIKGYATEKLNLYLIFEHAVILIEPIDGGSIKISEVSKYEHEYTCFNNHNTLIAAHDLVDKIESPKEPKSRGPYFTSSHIVILPDRVFQLLSHVYTVDSPVIHLHWQIDKTKRPYQYKPTEYRWNEPNTSNFCN